MFFFSHIDEIAQKTALTSTPKNQMMEAHVIDARYQRYVY